MAMGISIPVHTSTPDSWHQSV